MRKHFLWLLSFALVLTVALPDGDGVAYAQTFNVTFRVKMNIKMLEDAFRPATDIVRVAGSFNDWGSSTDTLKDADGDSIYTKIIPRPAGAIEYKFLKTLRNGLDWEGVANRTFTVSKDTVLPVVWFDNDSVFTPAVDVAVTFQVNMKVKMLEQVFQRGAGDIVRVAGSFNSWGSSTDTLKDADGDSIYTKAVMIREFTPIEYKFLKTLRGGSDWESGDNKKYTVPQGGGTLPVVFFDNDEVFNFPVSGNILWRIDMRTYEEIGWFRRAAGDSMELRGPFNNWLGTKMERVPGSEEYEIQLPYSGASFDNVEHKFFMDLDSAGATARFPEYVHSGDASTRDGFAYEHPAERGDGNRLFNLGNGGNLQTAPYYFSSINPRGLLLNTTDTVTVTFRVDMRPAMRYVDPFVKGTDTLKWMWFDNLARSAQGNPPAPIMTDANNDSIYEGSLSIRGKAHYNLLYYYRFIHAGGQTGTVDEGGGLGVQNPFRSRFIQPSTAGVGNIFPRNYTMPIDVWQKSAPLPAESAPFGIVTNVEAEPAFGTPVSFQLLQNYPNPFNPSTRIRYTLVEKAKVTLKIHNLLGQEVATLVNEEQIAGNYVQLFEAHTLAAGVYFYSLQAGNFREVKKMLLLK